MSPHFAPVACSGCQRVFPRLALDTTGRCPTCPADDRHPCVNRARVADVGRLLPLCVALLAGTTLTPWDHAAMAERADAAREAWIAAIEPELPVSLAWDPIADALVPGAVA